jgi:rhodanese-related sulfurtransferase
MEPLLIDVRSREEYIMSHIQGAINIPHQDLEYYRDLLRAHDVALYCNTGQRSAIAAEKLAAMGIRAEVLAVERVDSLPREGKTLVCAVNHVFPRPDQEERFLAKAGDLCRATEKVPGYLGSKILKMTGVSAAGSYLSGDSSRLNAVPPAYLLLTYWESAEAHERYHRDPQWAERFAELPADLVRMPYEEFYQVLK